MFGDLSQWAADNLGTFGSAGLAAPIPSEAILPLAGFLVDRGQLDAAQALAASTVGSLEHSVVSIRVGAAEIRWGGAPPDHGRLGAMERGPGRGR